MRLKLTIEYDGTPFRGWAAQPGLPTVEGALRDALADTFDEYGDLAVAGRTDTGVHALANVVSVEAEGGPPLDRVAAALNTRLPNEVAVVVADLAPPDFNARFSARGRSYRYRLHLRSAASPFEENRAWWYPRPLDEERLRSQAALLAGEHDFTAFTPTQTKHRVFTRVVESAGWARDGEHLDFHITADSFLRRMVRTLVGTMVDGIDLAPLLDGAPRSSAGATAPPHGLYLTSVMY